jgi:hypothetical protein
MSWLSTPLALMAAVVAGNNAPAPVDEGPGGGWQDPVVLRARPLLDRPAAVRPALAFDAGGEAAAAFVADGATGPRIAVALRGAGREAFGDVLTLPGMPELRTAGGRAPALAAGPRGTFAVVWLARTGARTAPAVLAAVRRPGRRFGPPVRLSAPGTRPMGAIPAVAVDGAGRVTVAWAERGPHGSVLVVRVRGRDARFAPAQRMDARGGALGPPSAAGPALGWAQGGRLLLRLERRRFDLGAAIHRPPALSATADGGRLAVAWRDRSVLHVAVPGVRAGTFPLSGSVAGGPLVGVDASGSPTVAWQDERGVLAATLGGRAQRLVSGAGGALLSGLAVGPGGDALVTVLDPVPSTRADAGDLVTAALRPAGGAFRVPVALSRPGRFTSLATPAFSPHGTALVAWASGVAVPPEALLLVATRPVAAASGAGAPSAPPAGMPAL